MQQAIGLGQSGGSEATSRGERVKASVASPHAIEVSLKRSHDRRSEGTKPVVDDVEGLDVGEGEGITNEEASVAVSLEQALHEGDIARDPGEEGSAASLGVVTEVSVKAAVKMSWKMS